jgi:hypothetical protein
LWSPDMPPNQTHDIPTQFIITLLLHLTVGPHTSIDYWIFYGMIFWMSSKSSQNFDGWSLISPQELHNFLLTKMGSKCWLLNFIRVVSVWIECIHQMNHHHTGDALIVCEQNLKFVLVLIECHIDVVGSTHLSP